MENHLILIDFFGLPGSGKSVISHRLSQLLSNEGLCLCEPTFDMDHHSPRRIRFFKKSFYAYLYQMFYCESASHLRQILKHYQNNSRLSFNKQKRNLFYKLYLINKSHHKIIIMDEGLAQAAISISIGTDNSASILFNEFKKALPNNIQYIPILIKSNIDRAFVNIQQRGTNDSRVEKMKESNNQIAFMKLFVKSIDEIAVNTNISVDATKELSINEIAALLRKKLIYIC